MKNKDKLEEILEDETVMVFDNYDYDSALIGYTDDYRAVYDYDLSAIMIKIKLNDAIIGRGCIPYCFMKLGFRRIPVYDNQCFNMNDVYMVGHFSLEKI